MREITKNKIELWIRLYNDLIAAIIFFGALFLGCMISIFYEIDLEIVCRYILYIWFPVIVINRVLRFIEVRLAKELLSKYE